VKELGHRFLPIADARSLIYYEYYRDIRDAIVRETQLKKWPRAKKVALIGRVNPSWLDLGVEVLQDR
jgi:putative endonuclease